MTVQDVEAQANFFILLNDRLRQLEQENQRLTAKINEYGSENAELRSQLEIFKKQNG